MLRPVAVIDANVLYGIEVTDLLLTLATQRVICVHWSDEILDEVRRNLATRPDLSDAAIEYRLVQMNRALPSALDSAPDELIDSMPINPKTHPLALAVHMEAPFVVSHNLRDFPTTCAHRSESEHSSPMASLAALGSDDLHDAVAMMSQHRRRPDSPVVGPPEPDAAAHGRTGSSGRRLHAAQHDLHPVPEFIPDARRVVMLCPATIVGAATMAVMMSRSGQQVMIALVR